MLLYPSIRLEQGMIALQWFMNHQTDFTPTLKDLCLKLARYVLTNNYVECKELDGAIYQQVVGGHVLFSGLRHNLHDMA
jgi:hypothetical protein